MKTLVIGNLGYIGPIVVKHFIAEDSNNVVDGYDIGFFENCLTPNGKLSDELINNQYYGDVRQFDASVMRGYENVVYLAAISNDPIGNLFEKPTLEINAYAAFEVATIAKENGCKNFIFASSCSVYGVANTEARNEDSEINPLTAYAKSKVLGEVELKKLASNDFKVTCLRFATACGFSDRTRLDLVLNDFVASAIATNKINILSDGTPWRPLIHIKDMARAIYWATDRTEGGDFLVINVGSCVWNYQVKELAQSTKDVFGNIEVTINENAPADKRSYKVDFSLFEQLAPNHQPKMTLQETIIELKEGLTGNNFHDQNFRQSSLIRLKVIQNLLDEKKLNKNLELI